MARKIDRSRLYTDFLARRGGLLKTCIRCGEPKKIAENFGLKVKKFYIARDGTRRDRPTPCVEADAYCNSCNSLRRSEYMQRAPKDVRDRQWENFQKLLDKKKVDPSINIRSMAKWRASNPQKSKAHYIANKVHKVAEMCSITGCSNSGEKHHPDYGEPENIVWLCRKHHKSEHQRLKKEKYARG